MTQADIISQFPILNSKVHGKKLVYFDNAATSQRPLSVLNKWQQMSANTNSNIHRAVHKIAVDATDEYETARDAVKDFIKAGKREEIIFTSGTTASINLAAFSFAEAFIKEGDEIIVGEAEHHSNIVPWQMMCQRKGAIIKVLPIDDEGHLLIEKLEELITNRTRLLTVAQISNVLGIINPVKEICSICRKKGVYTLIDGAQGIVHQNIDVQDIGCDFYVFSGHKMYAAPGTGVLYGRKELLEILPPYMGGGEMIETVSFKKTTYNKLPYKFEAGTPNIASIPTLVPAIEFCKQLEDKQLDDITDYLTEEFNKDKRIRLYGVPRGAETKIPLFSITVEGAHHEDLALILDKMGIAVRSGQMCAEPLMDRFGVSGMLRLSLAPYNTMEEARYFISSLNKAINMLV